MKLKFTKEQIELAKKIKVPFEITKDLSDDEICDLVDFFGDYLTMHCLDDEYAPNHEGDICYQVIDMIGEL